MRLKQLVALLLFFFFSFTYSYAKFKISAYQKSSINIPSNAAPILNTAVDIFTSDYQKVFQGVLQKDKDGAIQVEVLSKEVEQHHILSVAEVNQLRKKEQAFFLKVKNSILYVIGSDHAGAAYGVLELSRLIGVSPWEWWADASITQKKNFVLKDGYSFFNSPSVKYRGIFINDEDWGLTPWSTYNFEPGLTKVGKTKGTIGPKTYAKIFELLLRLRANTIWPAMHEVTVPFYLIPGNKEMADKYGIVVGTTHCEPLMRNSATEWDWWRKWIIIIPSIKLPC